MEFVSRFSLYEFTVLPFGLCNSPSTFQRLLNHVFSDIIDWYVLVYLDDILLNSKTIDSYEKYLHKVFLQLHAHKLQAKCAKCDFGHT